MIIGFFLFFLADILMCLSLDYFPETNNPTQKVFYKLYFLISSVSTFLIGHLLNLIAFSVPIANHSQNTQGYWVFAYLIPSIILLIGMAFTIGSTLFENSSSWMDQLDFFGFCLYYLILSLTNWRCFGKFFDENSSLSILPIFGYLLFMFSDILNAMAKFKIYQPQNLIFHEAIVFTAYWTSEILLSVFGVYFMS